MKPKTKLWLTAALLTLAWWAVMVGAVWLGLDGHALTITALGTLVGVFYAAGCLGRRASEIEGRGR